MRNATRSQPTAYCAAGYEPKLIENSLMDFLGADASGGYFVVADASDLYEKAGIPIEGSQDVSVICTCC